MSALDFIPWETAPKADQLEPALITWKGGNFSIPRLGYLTTSELQKIREVDPKNRVYRLSIDATNKIYSAMESDEVEGLPTREQIFMILNTLNAESMGAVKIDFSFNPAKELVESYDQIVKPFVESCKIIFDILVIRGATVMMQRIKPDWDDEKTIELPQGLRQKLYTFQQEEDYAGRDTDEESQRKAIEEDLKKLREAMQSIAIGRTSQNYTGNQPDSGQEEKSLADKTLAAFQDGMSSRQLRSGIDLKKKGFTGQS
jgi:hypothetical protein